VQGSLVGLDGQQVVGAAVDEKAGVVALGVRRIGGDDHTGKVEAGQQWPNSAISLVSADPSRWASMAPSWWSNAASRCTWWPAGAEPRNLLPSTASMRRVQPVGQPRADGGVHRVAVDPCRHPADGGLAGDLAAAGHSAPRWAAPLARALRRGGAQVVAGGRIPVQAMLAALDAAEESADTGCAQRLRVRGAEAPDPRVLIPRPPGRASASAVAVVGRVVEHGRPVAPDADHRPSLRLGLLQGALGPCGVVELALGVVVQHQQPQPGP
jgi:hypothetical protein